MTNEEKLAEEYRKSLWQRLINEDNHNIEGYDEGVIAWCEIPTYKE